MIKKKQYVLALIFTWLVTLLPSMYYLYMQAQENIIVDQFLSSHNLIGLPISKESAVRISDQIRKDFNVNESSFIALDLENRPFLREDVGFLITHKEGVCGEGTRVIVNLLNRLGFDSTRVTLYNRKLQPTHTLISVIIDEQEFLLDSINSSIETNDLLKKYDISSNDFNLMHYSDNVAERRSFVKTNMLGKPEEFVNFFNHYWLYSYEATPYSKLLTKIGFDVRVFNFSRPQRWISIMAEKPNTIMFFVTFVTSIFIMFLLHIFGIIRNILRIITAH